VEADLELPVVARPLEARAENRALRIVYLVPVTSPGGGARVLFEHVNHLSALGDEVTVVSHFPPPDWTELLGRFVEVPPGQPLETAIPDCDLIVAGFWEQILLARRTAIAPVIHLEQGSAQLFGAIDPQTLVTMAASVRAADATMAVGPGCAAALADRFGVTCEVVGNAVDGERFRPGDPSSPRRSVLFAGDDAEPFDGIVTARQIAFELATTHPDVDVVWVTPRPPANELPGRVVVHPSEDELARLYREALVYVCTSRSESAADLASLQAMASGAVVVSSAPPSSHSSAHSSSQGGIPGLTRHEENALLGPAGDAAALCGLVRRVLDDEALAARLSEAGVRTARETTWPDVVRDVRSFLESVLHADRAEAPGGDVEINLGDVVLVEHDALARLSARARSCPTSELAIPVSRPVRGAFRRVSWEVVARRPGAEAGVTKVYIPGRSERVAVVGEQLVGLEALQRGEHQAALAALLPQLQQGNKDDEPTLLRWVVVALLGLRRWQDALDLARAGCEAYPSHPDFLALAFMAAASAAAPIDLETTMRSVKVLGNGSRYDEWFDDPFGLLRHHLVGTLAL
jgi:glycosyltransferase involved in cell wall biosynthesis